MGGWPVAGVGGPRPPTVATGQGSTGTWHCTCRGAAATLPVQGPEVTAAPELGMGVPSRGAGAHPVPQ